MAEMKTELAELLNQLPDDASWDDLMYALYASGKTSLGLSVNERDEPMTREKFDQLFQRAESAHDLPDDMRNTLIYHPGNMTTVGIVAGVIAAAFAFVFPPIAWLAAPVAFIAGLLGVVAGQPRAWVAMLLAAVTFIPFLPMLSTS